MQQPASSRAFSAVAMFSSLVLATFGLTVSAQSAKSPQDAISRTQPTAPVPANAPRFASSGLEIKIASFGVSKKDQQSLVRVTISLIVMNTNDYDVALLNVEGFGLIDNAGNSYTSHSLGSYEIGGLAYCLGEVRSCAKKDATYFVPHDQYTVVSAKTAIPATYFTKVRVEDDSGDLFTFSTKMLMYKVGSDNEIAQTTKVQAPRLVTIGIPNILRR